MWEGRGFGDRVLLAATLLLSCTLRSERPVPDVPPRSSAHPAAAGPGSEASRNERRRKAELPQPSSMRVPVEPADPKWGSPVAPVTVVVFTDLRCPYCARVEPTLDALKQTYGPMKLRFVIKHFPFHENSESLARIAQGIWFEAGDRPFFDFLRGVFERQEAIHDEASLGELLRRYGLDPLAIRKAALDPAVNEKLRADQKLVRALAVRGTPTFFINGAELSGAHSLEDFRVFIDRELEAAEKLVASGTAPKLVYATRVGVNTAEESRRQASEPAQPREGELPPTDSLVRVPIAGTPQRGPRDALVTIVEFSDYECPYSRQVQDTLDKLFELHPGKLRLSRRENPLPFHRRARAAAEFALEARAQKGDAVYFKVTRALFLSDLGDASLEDIGKGYDLDVSRLKTALKSNRHRAAIERDQDLAADLGATSTPSFFVNGWRLSGAQPLDRFRRVVAAQLKVAEALVARGVPRARVYDELMKTARAPDPPARLELPPPSADLPSKGPKNAQVTIEIFGDLECRFCARASETMRAVEQAYPKQVRFVWRHFPLESIHPRARAAARVVEAARAQKGDAAFFEMVDRFYRDLDEEDAFSEARLRAYATELGLDADRLVAAATDTRFDATIDRDLAVGTKAGIEATPTFSIAGYELTGAQPPSAFKRLIKIALAQPRQ
jgi:protein-disulfide isomerase